MISRGHPGWFGSAKEPAKRVDPAYAGALKRTKEVAMANERARLCAQGVVSPSSSSSSSSFTRDAPTRTTVAKSFLPRLRGRRLDWIWVVRDEGIPVTVRVLNIILLLFFVANLSFF